MRGLSPNFLYPNRHHELLCVGAINSTMHPLYLFKEHAILNNELFLLAAQAIACMYQEETCCITCDYNSVYACHHSQILFFQVFFKTGNGMPVISTKLF